MMMMRWLPFLSTVCILGGPNSAVLAQLGTFTTLTSPSTTTRTPTSFFATSSAGPVLDAQCNVEDIEEANDSQLYTILQELIQTSFFRTFAVDLDTTCPLNKEEDDEEEFQCGSDKDEESSSSLDSHGSTGFGFGADDDDNEPLCTVKHDDDDESLDSSALNSLSHSGFSSKDQQETFEWTQQTDMVVQPNADLYVAEDCASTTSDNMLTDGLLPDTFWMDMCSNITQGNGTKTVNLPFNPERNTGYNGTHIWEAIYQETNFESVSSSKQAQYEQRVLYRLISGLHTQTTLSIASHYYPPSPRKGRLHWQAHPTLFYEKFRDHPEYLRNLHFSYVVLLRALKKAAPFLVPYEVRTGDIVQDHAAQVLLKRLLDSSILKSCSSVFKAFDESSMFQKQEEVDSSDVVQVQQDFKAVFHNISSILDCVQCQQCKLHGKLVMLGYGTALKILFIKSEQYLTLERNEIVALINSIAKISESLRQVRDLTQLYWEHQQEEQQRALEQPNTDTVGAAAGVSSPSVAPTASPKKKKKLTLDVGDSSANSNNWELVDAAVGLASSLGKKGYVSVEREAELVQMALSQSPQLLILAKHYSDDIQKFWNFCQSAGLLIQEEKDDADQLQEEEENQQPDAIVVGSGLAGLAASLNILDRGGKVILLEKEHLLGGNSNKASSGINGYNNITDVTVEIFQNDTIKSAGDGANLDLIQTLTMNSPKAITFLKERVGVDLSLKAQLGGHSQQRTHRPNNGMAGAEIIYNIQRAVRKYEKTGQITIMVDTKVTELITTTDGDETHVIGVKYQNSKKDDSDGDIHELYSPNIVLTTGGFASDRSSGSYLEKYRPELLKFPTTAGSFSTGDGIKLATDLGADMVSMDKVQIHPTGWVDPKDPNNPTKILAAELMRGIGGLLINKNGERFCNELGTRAYVTDQMLSHNPNYNKTKKWDLSTTIPTFYLVLSSSAVDGGGKKHVDLYTHKGLLTKVEGFKELAQFMNLTAATSKTAHPKQKQKQRRDSKENLLLNTLKSYAKSSVNGKDEFGKTVFRGVPNVNDIENETFYVGMVTPVLHYCMGGITIDTTGNVLNKDGNIIQGLHAAGEVTGGVHGNNRLAGNSLLECTVYGTIVGEKIPIHTTSTNNLSTSSSGSGSSSTSGGGKSSSERKITIKELEQHNTEDDCWVAIHGTVYDLTDFAEEHPAGAQSIFDLAGKDGSEAFAAIHNEQMLEDFEEDQVGILV